MERQSEELLDQAYEQANRGDFSGWVAMEDPCQDEWKSWLISPRVFWKEEDCIPDWCMGFEVPGFWECCEHTLDTDEEDPEAVLRALGFEIVKWDE